MQQIDIFQQRPVGTKTGNYALNRSDVAELLADVIFLPAGKKQMTHAEDFEGDARIVSVSNFSNGVVAKLEVEDYIIDALAKRCELKILNQN